MFIKLFGFFGRCGGIISLALLHPEYIANPCRSFPTLQVAYGVRAGPTTSTKMLCAKNSWLWPWPDLELSLI